MLCPKCRKNEMEYYNGSLGYESMVCPYCKLDAKSEEALTYWNNYTSELRAENRDLKEQKKRRNTQIADLKNKIKGLKEEIDRNNFLSQGITGEYIKEELTRLNKNYKP